MDFFDHQDRARRRTGRLAVLFTVAVLVIMALVYVAVVVFVAAVSGEASAELVMNPMLMAAVGAGVLTVVLLGSLYKIAVLSGGGRVVAEALGGRPIGGRGADLSEQRLHNVVEEMALASGTPVPPVYVMDEASINAFAAGYAPSDAVIGVTRGCMEQLDRDQLQGVVAHEFSHILNGDMRLNIRLMGLIHGILVIGILGYALLRATASGGRRVRRGSKGGGGQAAVLGLGLALMIIGYAGTFFGNLIKAAVSRQREFLADASAVQFTRNPLGIAGALRKIGAAGSGMAHPRAREVSHMLFAQGFASMLGSLLATHPPLPERIRRIEEGSAAALAGPPRAAVRASAAREGAAREDKARASARRAAGLAVVAVTAGAEAAPVAPAVAHIGRPAEAHLEYARRLTAALPRELAEAAANPYDARALVFALLLSDEPSTRAAQSARLTGQADAGLLERTAALRAQVRGLDPSARLPLIDLSLPALRQMSPPQYEAFEAAVASLILADERVDLFEWVLRRIILHHLEGHFRGVQRRAVVHHALPPLAAHCAILLSSLAYVGQTSRADAARAFAAGAKELGLEGLALLPPEQCGLRGLDAALAVLEGLAPQLKRALVSGCAACISADRQVTPREGELFRAIADALSCPVPPILPGQRLI